MTCGPTWAAIDRIRIISNQSSGKLGHLLAENLIKKGARVTLLEGPVTHTIHSGLKNLKIIKFLFYDDLSRLFNSELKKNYAAVIHSAAVSDYKIKNPSSGKISSSKKQLTLKLVPTQKLIEKIKKINPRIFLVGFKLEDTKNFETLKVKAKNLFMRASCDLVVANFSDGNTYSGWIMDQDKPLIHAKSRNQLAFGLTRILDQKL